ncbi:MAG: dihydrofolate reductase family protein [Bacteroidia bacterium]|nr:dihydrofolate reductase family protein [Bacteroidia bacterium]
MRKVVAAFNMTLDGNCDHTAGLPDEEVHQHYTDLLDRSDVILYGRTTYQLMEFWRTFLEKPSGEQTMDAFAAAIDRIPKIVFSRSLKEVDWKSACLAELELKETVERLRQQPGRDILIGSRSLIQQLMKLRLIDELQLCIHPVVAGKGMSLFEDMDRTVLRLVNAKRFDGGAIVLYYKLEAS